MPSGTAWSTEPEEREASVPVVVPSRTNGKHAGMCVTGVDKLHGR